MSDTLAVRFAGMQLDGALNGNYDGNHNVEHNFKRLKTSHQFSVEYVKKTLGDYHLSSSNGFSAKRLNTFQQQWRPDYSRTGNKKIDEQRKEARDIEDVSTCQMASPQTRTITRFTREGLDGRVAGYHEVTVPANSANAKNSTSLLRRPAGKVDFIRGAAGFFPFAPGGLDGVEAIQAFEDQERIRESDRAASRRHNKRDLTRLVNFGTDPEGLLTVPPGFTRGGELRPKDDLSGEEKNEAEEVEDILQQEDDVSADEGAGTPDLTNGDHDSSPGSESADDFDDADLADILPNEFAALQPRGQLAASSSTRSGREWAHVVDVNKDIPNFDELVPEMARTWPFELDTFQKEAVYHLENGDSVFVAAHTSAGKTVVAEYAIALAAKHMTKAIYTSPIKALSNQKFRDFKGVFDDVGILTGDVQINPEASCLIMTTEILRSMLYRGADLIRDVEFVIFDEVHYVNDLERGVVWEEVIIMLPDHVSLILLSATVPNTLEFASWVGRTKKKNIYVISTAKRPVPLEHYLWAGKDMHKIVDPEKRFIEKGWKAANDILSGLDKVKEQKSTETSTPPRGGNNQRGGRGQQQRGGGQRGNTNQRGNQRGGRGGQPANRGQGNIARTGRGGGRTTAAQDRTVWVSVVAHLHRNNLLPCCIFVFSKKRCEENAESLSNQDFSTAAEKSAIHMTVEKSIARLKPEDRVLPQIRRIREMLSRGIAVHHGGLLPIVKEIVEILFAKTLVKVLFATETFAMGLNLPTRTVVFSGYRKHDGREFRNLLPGEYTQMAGRAGRRGLDTVGTVVVVASGKTEAPPAAELRQMMLGQPTKLRSQFRLHYNMILNLMRVEALKIEEMIKRSFSENATQALLPQHEKQVQLSLANLEKIKREPCDICDVDLEACHEAAMEFEALTNDLHIRLMNSPVGKRMWSGRRLIVFKKDGIRTIGFLTEEGLKGNGSDVYLRVLEVAHVDAQRYPSDLLPYLPQFRPWFHPMPSEADTTSVEIVRVPLEDVEAVTQTLVKADTRSMLSGNAEQKRFVEGQFLTQYTGAWTTPEWNEESWNKVQDLQVREILTERQKMAAICQNAKCLDCPHFLKHFTMQHDQWLVQSNIQTLRLLMSDQNLALLPDYEQRVEVLKDLGFVDADMRVQLKGKVACEIHSADELILSECIFENIFAEHEPEDIVALLSSFVFREKTDNEPNIPDHLMRGIASITKITERVAHVQLEHQVVLSNDDLSNGAEASNSNSFVPRTKNDVGNGASTVNGVDTEDAGERKTTDRESLKAICSQPRFGLVEVVYEWARGMSFNRITDLTDVMEGTIVRVVTRLDETCREVMNAARLIGDPTLYAKMDKARELIRRDVVFTASLYM